MLNAGPIVLLARRPSKLPAIKVIPIIKPIHPIRTAASPVFEITFSLNSPLLIAKPAKKEVANTNNAAPPCKKGPIPPPVIIPYIIDPTTPKKPNINIQNLRDIKLNLSVNMKLSLIDTLKFKLNQVP